MRRTGGALLVAALVVGVLWAAQGPAGSSGRVYPQAYWDTNGSSVHVWGEAYAHDFGCGLKDCATASDLYFQAGRLSGSTPDESRVAASVEFGGVGISVGVSAPLGASAGFTDGGSSCDHGWWDAPGGWVSVDLGSGEICNANTWGWVSNMELSTTGGVRFGGEWVARSASANISLGGL